MQVLLLECVLGAIAKRKSKRKVPTVDAQQAALSFFTNANYQQAAVMGRALIKRYPRHGFAWKLLGASLGAMQQFDQALQVTQQAVLLCPDDDDAMSNLGSALNSCQQHPQAILILKRALAINPHHATAKNNLGVALLNSGLAAEAITTFHDALSQSLTPADTKTLCNLGIAYFQINHIEAAGHCFQKALATAPDCLDALQGYGTICQCCGQLPQAIQHFRKALALQLTQPSREVAPHSRPSFSSQQNETLMWQTLAQLAASGVHAFATSGTLLGLQREGCLLSFDKDIDFGLPYAEHAAAQTCLVAHGWTPVPGNHGLINPRAYCHDATGLSLDLFGFQVEPDTGITLGGLWLKDAPPGWSRITEHPTIHLNSVTGPHGVVWALADPHAWLEVIYGDWRTPDPDFDTVIAAKNLRGFSLLTQCYAFSRIYNHWHKGHLKKALSTTRHSLRHLPDDALLQQVQAHLQATLAQVTAVRRRA